jgi:rubrerythrin
VTSLLAQYPDLIKDEWYYLSHSILDNPDNILPIFTQTYFWKCKNCGHVYRLSPKLRIENQIRNIDSCPHCKGLRNRFNCY